MTPESTPSSPITDADKAAEDREFQARQKLRYEQSYKGFVSPDIITGIGRNAVIAAIDKSIVATNGQEFLQPFFEEGQNRHLANDRKRLEMLQEDAAKAKELATLFTLEPMSPWLVEALGLEGSGGTIVQALTAHDANGYKVGDETFLNFLEWHNHALASVQEKLDQRAPEIKDAFAARFFQAVQKGWIPKSAEDNLQHLDDVTFIVDDGIKTDLDRTRGMTVPFAERDIVVTLSPRVLDDEGLQAHELLHVTAGRQNAAEGSYDIGMKRVFGNGAGGVSMNEAVVEHLAGSLVYGRIDTVEPFKDKHRSDVYFSERGLLNALTTGGVRPINIRLFIEAYFENETTEANDRLRSELREAFPFADVASEIGSFAPGADGSVDQDDLFAYETKLLEQAADYKLQHKSPAIQKLHRWYKHR